MRLALAFAALLLATATAAAQTCKTTPNLVGACFEVHGILSVDKGSRIRIAANGNIYGVWDRQFHAQGDEIVPPQVAALLKSAGIVEGDYTLCPFEKPASAGFRAVCIESATISTKKR